MLVNLPENIGEITLDQYLKYEKLRKREDLTDDEHNKRAVCIFTDIPYNKIDKIEQNDYEVVISQIVAALNAEVPFVKTFKLNGIEYGFEPDLNGISKGQYGDMMSYQGDTDNMHKLMATLFRPVTKKDKLGNYEIEPYSGTEQHAETLKGMPMNVVNGAITFFLNLRKALLISTLRYIREERRKKSPIGTGQSGDGTQPTQTYAMETS